MVFFLRDGGLASTLDRIGWCLEPATAAYHSGREQVSNRILKKGKTHPAETVCNDLTSCLSSWKREASENRP
jgi:hypothetical protein